MIHFKCRNKLALDTKANWLIGYNALWLRSAPCGVVQSHTKVLSIMPSSPINS
jgi:hypothetical protein